MKQAKISVIIPVYNAEKYLAQAIESIVNQSLKPAEIILVDDGSTDASIKVAQKFEAHIKLIQQKNLGAGAARNTGIKNATCEYLAFLDADDLWLANKLKNQWFYLKNNPDKNMVFGMVEQFISPELPPEHQNKLKTELKKMPGLLAGTMLIKKETFLEVGPFNEKLELGEFIDWYSRAQDKGIAWHVMDEVMLKRRIHTTNMGLHKKQHLNDYTTLLREALARKRKANN